MLKHYLQILINQFVYANEENPGSSILWLPFYYQALSMESTYANFCAYDNYIFGARLYKTAYDKIDLKILGGHFVYAIEDNTGS